MTYVSGYSSAQGGNGKSTVQLAVLIKIQEDGKALRRKQQTPAVSRRMKVLAEQLGTSKVKRAFGVDVLDANYDTTSDKESHEFLRNALVTNDWAVILVALRNSRN